MPTDLRTRSQRLADSVTAFSGSWGFIGWFSVLCLTWIAYNVVGGSKGFDPYPFLFLNWMLTMVSTFQSPLILLSQNRQNETDREHMKDVLSRLDDLQKTINSLSGDQ